MYGKHYIKKNRKHSLGSLLKNYMLIICS